MSSEYMVQVQCRDCKGLMGRKPWEMRSRFAARCDECGGMVDPVLGPDSRPLVHRDPKSKADRVSVYFAICWRKRTGNLGDASYGYVLMDRADGNRVLAREGVSLGRTTPTLAYFKGAVAALDAAMAVAQGRRLEILTESKITANQLRGRYGTNDPDGEVIIAEARGLMARFPVCKVADIMAKDNQIAKKSAKDAIGSRGRRRAG